MVERRAAHGLKGIIQAGWEDRFDARGLCRVTRGRQLERTLNFSSKCFQIAAVASIQKALKSNSGGSRKSRRTRIITSSNRRYLLTWTLHGERGRTNHHVLGKTKRLMNGMNESAITSVYRHQWARGRRETWSREGVSPPPKRRGWEGREPCPGKVHACSWDLCHDRT